jgi:hypothetical protein
MTQANAQAKTQNELGELQAELVLGAIQGNLTEGRYNEILDILLVIAAPSIEATATLKECGELEWIERRNRRTVAA